MKVLTRGLITALYSLAIALGEILDGIEMGLFTNDPELTTDTVLADLAQPTFTGYALKPITLVAAVDSDGEPTLVAPPTVFIPTNGINLPQLITGCFLVDSGGLLLAAGKFDVQVALSDALQQLHATGKIDIDPTQPATFEGGLA